MHSSAKLPSICARSPPKMILQLHIRSGPSIGSYLVPNFSFSTNAITPAATSNNLSRILQQLMTDTKHATTNEYENAELIKPKKRKAKAKTGRKRKQRKPAEGRDGRSLSLSNLINCLSLSSMTIAIARIQRFLSMFSKSCVNTTSEPFKLLLIKTTEKKWAETTSRQ